MKSLGTVLCFLLMACTLLFLCTTDVRAQGITTAAMNGKVTSKTGEPLPGVNIIAVHIPSGTRYGTSTRDDGRFNLPNLRTGGPYTVTASLVGYRGESQREIYLRLSESLDLNMSLAEEAVQAGEVVVIGERSSVFNASRTGAATNVERTQIDRLPTLTRNFQDYYQVSPYFTPATASGTTGNILGRSSRYSNIQVDGTNFNDLFGLGATGAPAGQSTVTPISLDAIEEFQLIVSPYDVRQAGFTGAGINAITRSGTNTAKGSLFYFGRNEGWVGKSPDTLKKKLDGFNDWQFGLRIGGPIIENKLFYFLNGELTTYNQPLSRTFGNQNLGTNAYTVSKDSIDLITNYLKTKYNYDPGVWSGVPQIRESKKYFARLDYNLSESHKLTARWSFLESTEDNSPSRGRSTIDIYAENARYKLDNRTNSVTLQATSIFGNTASNELTLGYVDQFDQPTFYGTPFPTLSIATRGVGTTYTGQQQLLMGSEEFRHYNLLGQKTFEIADNFSWYLPDHTVTLGAKIDFLSFRNLFISDGFGAYWYSSIARFLRGLPPDGNISSSTPYSFRYSATNDPLQEANWGARQFGFYAQDEWTVTSALKLTAGVRVDIPTYPDRPSYNKDVDASFGLRTDILPKTTVAFSPRLGFNWAVDEARNTQVRGGVGIFYGRFPYVWVSNQYSNTGVDFYTITTPPATFNPDPYNQTKPSSATLPSAEVDLTDRNFKAPSILRWTLAVDHKLPYDLSVSVEGIFSLTQNDVYYQNINLKGLQDNSGVLSNRPALTPGGKLAGENREVWGKLDTAATRYTTQWINTRFSPGVFLVRNTSKGSNSNVTVQIQRNAPSGLNGSAAYTWGLAKDINSMNSTTASSGWRYNPTPGNPNEPQLAYSQWDRRHRIMTNVSYRQEWSEGWVTNIGVFYNGQAGRPFSYMVAGDVNGDGRSDNDLVYIPKDKNDILLANAAGTTLARTDAAYDQVMAFIDADSYLKANKGKISERSGPREPWAHSVSLRLSQEIPTYTGQRFEVTLDILNVLNLLKNDWGWIRNTGVNQTVNMLTFKGLEKTVGSDYGKPKYQWTGLKVTDGKADPFQPDNILSRWQAQIGVRYTF